MPVEIGIWRLGQKVERIQFSSLPSESKLEQILTEDITILDPNLLLIGRQVPTDLGQRIDLLAIDPDGKLVVIELKRDRTPRDVVAQILEYGSWVRKLETEDVAKIFSEYLKKYHPGKAQKSLDEIFCEQFRVKGMPETLNEDHELCVVASEMDASTERIVTYLADEYGAGINVVFFGYYRDGDREYLSRVWLIDPGDAETKIVENRGQEPWNGEYYVSFGGDERRRWEDARKHGYISAGGAAWYSKTLDILEPGSRIWVNVPGWGYVGVGRVTDKVKPVTEFRIKSDDGKLRNIREVLRYIPSEDIVDKQEHFVGVEWIKTVPLNQAVKEKGFFGNQNSAAKPRDKKWNHTVERLKTIFDINSQEQK